MSLYRDPNPEPNSSLADDLGTTPSGSISQNIIKANLVLSLYPIGSLKTRFEYEPLTEMRTQYLTAAVPSGSVSKMTMKKPIRYCLFNRCSTGTLSLVSLCHRLSKIIPTRPQNGVT